MVQVIDMTDEEKFEMYMKVPHEELVRMKIEEEKILKRLEKERPVQVYVHDNTSTITTSTSITFDELVGKVNQIDGRLRRLESRHIKRGGTNPIIHRRGV